MQPRYIRELWDSFIELMGEDKIMSCTIFISILRARFMEGVHPFNELSRLMTSFFKIRQRFFNIFIKIISGDLIKIVSFLRWVEDGFHGTAKNKIVRYFFTHVQSSKILRFWGISDIYDVFIDFEFLRNFAVFATAVS